MLGNRAFCSVFSVMALVGFMYSVKSQIDGAGKCGFLRGRKRGQMEWWSGLGDAMALALLPCLSGHQAEDVAHSTGFVDLCWD